MGVEWLDDVCVTDSACIKDFEYFLISQQQGLNEPVDGIFGLARNHPYFLAEGQGVQRGPSYMNALKNARLISENTFSFKMTTVAQQSSFDIGQPRED